MQIELGAQYGMYSSLLSLTLIFSFLLDLGTTSFNLRELAVSSSFLNKTLQVLIPLRILLIVLYFFVILIAGKLLGHTSDEFYALILIGFNQILLSWIIFFRSMVAGLHQYKRDSLLSVLDKLLMVLIGAPFLLIPYQKMLINIFTLISIQTAAFVLTISTILVFVRPILKNLSWSPNLKLFLPVLKKALPFAMLTFLMGIYTRVDIVMLEHLLPNGARETNTYAAAYRLLEALNMAPILISGFLLPMLVRAIESKTNVNQLVSVAFIIIGSIGGVAIAISYFNAETLMQLMYPNMGAELISTFKILMLSFFPFCMMFVFGTLLTAAHQINFLNKVSFLGVILNFSMNLYIIPIYGSVGAAYTTLFTQLFVVVFQIYKGYKSFSLILPLKGWILPGLYFGITGIVAYALSTYFSNVYWNFVIEIIIVGIIFWLTFSNNERQELFKMFTKKT